MTELNSCLDAFENFIHADTPGIPLLVKAALLHVQFESIHPFLDGNGRLGRLLITLYLCSQRALREPLLYLSLFFRQNRSDYYRILQEVRERRTWEAWLEFFLDGVTQTAEQAFDSAIRITGLFKSDRDRIASAGDRTGSALRLHELLQTNPYLTATVAVKRSGLTMPTVNGALAELQKLGVATELPVAGVAACFVTRLFWKSSARRREKARPALAGQFGHLGSRRSVHPSPLLRGMKLRCVWPFFPRVHIGIDQQCHGPPVGAQRGRRTSFHVPAAGLPSVRALARE